MLPSLSLIVCVIPEEAVQRVGVTAQGDKEENAAGDKGKQSRRHQAGFNSTKGRRISFIIASASATNEEFANETREVAEFYYRIICYLKPT